MVCVGVDILGPFLVTDSGNSRVLVAMDYFTKWPKAYAVPDQSGNTTAERLVEEMFAHIGAPAELHRNQGRHLEACRWLRVGKTRTTAPPRERWAGGGVQQDHGHPARHPHQPTPAGLGPPPAPGPVVRGRETWCS